MIPGADGVTRDEAYAACPADAYVEFYGGRWLVVPFAPVVQPEFFHCTPAPILKEAA